MLQQRPQKIKNICNIKYPTRKILTAAVSRLQ